MVDRASLFNCLVGTCRILNRAARRRCGPAKTVGGIAAFSSEELEPGKSFTLNGEWLYQPGYAFTTNDQPQLTNDLTGYAPVPVPQLLNRIHWWLDDSEDFKKDEDARLKRLGL
jgi:hypothetical protein